VIVAEIMAPSSALPIGATRAVSEMQPLLINPATPGSGLLNGVLAVLGPLAEDEAERYDEEILDLYVLGFVVMSVVHSLQTSLHCDPHNFSTSLDMANRKMTILAPSGGGLIGKIAVLGSFEWSDAM
jgi:polyribonucleotide 5'-hydroxyl-kinase